jgi:endonuclease/exonuclease/phosphatase family metal-dependent hydrolase
MNAPQSNTLLARLNHWAPITITTVFGMQLLKVLLPGFVGYLRDSVGVGSLDLAPIALGIFALSFLAGPLRRLAGAKAAFGITAGGVALARIAEQISTAPQLDLYLSAAGAALFLMFIPVALGEARSRGTDGTGNFSLMFLLGIAIDTAIHIGRKTMELSWQAGILPIAIVFALGIWLLASLRRYLAGIDPSAASDGRWGRTLTLIALGPWLLLQLIVFQNVARVSALTGWETSAAGALVLAANALGLAAAAQTRRGGNRAFGIALVCGLLLVLSLAQPEISGIPGAFLLLAGQILSAILVTVILTGLGWEATFGGLAKAAVANGIGQLLFVLLIFAYYVSFDIALGVKALTLLPIAAAIVALAAIGASRGQITYGEEPADFQPAYVAAALLLVPVALAITWKQPAAIQPDAGNNEIRIMSYNLHNGFNTDGRLDMEALAQVIEAQEADIIGLQEISRGWIIWGNLDMLLWLSQRLEMPYISGPTADAQWGNAVLSRYPIVSAELLPLPPDGLLLERGYIVANIDVGGATLAVINTHFSHRDTQSQERQFQASELISTWNNAANTVILGDLNAEPDSPEMQLLADAGLISANAALGTPPGYTYYSADPYQQIDYIWASPDLLLSDFIIPPSTASDHLGMAVTITIP